MDGLTDCQTTSTIVAQVLNDTENLDGFAPSQWVLGAHQARIPGSLLQSDESAMLETQQAAADPTSSMARNLQRRESARVSRIRLDNDARLRAGMLRRSTPSRGPFPVGSYVYFRRTRQFTDSPDPTHQWFGVARVIGHERSNSDRADDPETHPDHGESSHGVWLRYRQTTVLASPEQLRFATADEQLLLDELPPTMVTTPSNLGPRQYLDIRDEAPIDGQPSNDHGNQEGGGW